MPPGGGSSAARRLQFTRKGAQKSGRKNRAASGANGLKQEIYQRRNIMRPWIRLSSMVILSPALIVGCGQKSSTTGFSSNSTGSYPAYASSTSGGFETPIDSGSPAYRANPDYTSKTSGTKYSRNGRNGTVEPVSTTDDPARVSAYGISFDELRSRIKDHSAVLVDARTSDQYALGHLRNSINIPAGVKGDLRQRYLSNTSPDQLIVVYCSSASCNSSDMLAEQLMAQGFTNVRVFTPGWQVLSRQRDLR